MRLKRWEPPPGSQAEIDWIKRKIANYYGIEPSQVEVVDKQADVETVIRQMASQN